MNEKDIDEVTDRRRFNIYSQADLVNINGRNFLIFKTDGFSEMDPERAPEDQYTGKFSKSVYYNQNAGVWENIPMPFLVFYDLDSKKVVDQIYGG
jgi:hypothetical protein